MKLRGWLFGVVPALLGSVSLVQADDAQTLYTLTGTVGGVALNLPDGGGDFQGVGIDDTDDWLLGATIGFGGTVSLGSHDGYNTFAGLTGFLTYATGGSDKTHTFTGPGTVVIQGGAGPNQGAISIATSSSPASANSQVTVSNLGPLNEGTGASPNITSPATSAQDVAFVSASGNSFSWGGAQTAANNTVGRAAAYAAIADTNGGVFIAAGDLTGLSIKTDYTTEVFYAGADLTLGASGDGSGGVAFAAYGGPSFRYLGQRNSTNTAITVDVPEYEAITDFPIFGMSSTEELNGYYLGAVAGLTATMPIDEKSSFTLGGEVAGYYAHASLDSSGVYTVEGGGPVPYVLQTVTAKGANYEASEFALALRATAVYSVALNETTQLSFAGMADYLSRVARPGVNVDIAGYGGTDDGTVEYESGGSAPRISWGDMLAFSGSVSLTGQF
jgi:hypothetical protein